MSEKKSDSPEDAIFIHGIGIGNYRSFGPDLQRIGPFNKVNLFIGRNNSGKSNVLRFIHTYYVPTMRSLARNDPITGFLSEQQKKDFDSDKHFGNTIQPVRFATAVSTVSPAFDASVQAVVPSRVRNRHATIQFIKDSLSQPGFLDPTTGLTWSEFEAAPKASEPFRVPGCLVSP